MKKINVNFLTLIAQVPEGNGSHSVQEFGNQTVENAFDCEACDAALRCRSCGRSADALVLERFLRRPSQSATFFRHEMRGASPAR